ncbi:fatty acid alpha-hydroxylase, partial [Ascosphaera atra]
MSTAATMTKFTPSEVEKHNTYNSCFVTKGQKVYDVTEFLNDHPGGPDFILEYAGKDVSGIMADATSHPHSESAYEILDEYQVGVLSAATDDEDEPVFASTGLSKEEDLSKETDLEADFKKHHFLDLSHPLLPQMWRGNFSKEFYLDQ